jgi:hypothetical protein
MLDCRHICDMVVKVMFRYKRAAILIVFKPKKADLKQKATGMGTPAAVNSRSN